MGIASVGGNLFLFAAYAAVAHLVPKSVFGEYQLAGTLMAIAALTAYPKMSGALITAAARKAFGTFPVAISAVRGKSKYGILGLTAFSAYYAATGRYGLAGAIAASIPFFMPYATSGFYEAYSVGTGNIAPYALRSLAASFASAAALVLAALLFPTYSAVLVFSFFCAMAATTGRWVYENPPYSTSHDAPVSEEALSFGKRTSWTEAVIMSANYADILLLNAFLGPREVAIYGIARIVPEGIKGLVKNVGVLAAARITTMDGRAVGSMLALRLAQATIASFIVAIGYVVCAPTVFALLFPAHPEALPYSQLLAVSFMAFPAHLAESTLGALLKKKEMITLNAGSALATFALSLGLIPTFGIIGAVLARVISRFLSGGLALALARRSL